MQFMANGSEMCVSWDFDMERWTPDGCNTSIGQGGVITCRCNHLTNFAVLVVIKLIIWLLHVPLPEHIEIALSLMTSIAPLILSITGFVCKAARLSASC